MVLEVPKACLVSGPGQSGDRRLDRGQREEEGRRPPRPQSRLCQVSRLGAPLVNEVVIGLKDKDKFNASEPKDDAQFLDYVTHPTLPALIEILFGAAGVRAPTQFPRTDLIAAFLTGLDGLNKTKTPSEMLRLNTSIAAKAAPDQSNLGALGGDLAGFPNGRRPGDDVVDIELRVAMGALLPAESAPSGALALHRRRLRRFDVLRRDVSVPQDADPRLPERAERRRVELRLLFLAAVLVSSPCSRTTSGSSPPRTPPVPESSSR